MGADYTNSKNSLNIARKTSNFPRIFSNIYNPFSASSVASTWNHNLKKNIYVYIFFFKFTNGYNIIKKCIYLLLFDWISATKWSDIILNTNIKIKHESKNFKSNNQKSI